MIDHNSHRSRLWRQQNVHTTAIHPRHVPRIHGAPVVIIAALIRLAKAFITYLQLKLIY